MPNQLNRSNNQNVDCQNDESSKELIDKVVPEIKPKDRYNLAYISFFVLGMTSCLPWLFFLNSQIYWKYKFRNTTLDKFESTNNTSSSKLQNYFTAYLDTASAVPYSVFVIVNIFMHKWISWRIRVIITQLGIIMLFLVSTIFVKINTDEWQHLFLKITLITAAGLNALGSILAGTIFGVVGHFPPKYISSCSQGLSSSGILSTILQILSLWLSTGPIATGFMYFLIGLFIFLSSFFSYIFLEKQEFFKYYIKNKPVNKKSIYCDDDTTSSAENNSVSYMKILFKIWPYGLSMFITFSATYGVFPAINTLVKSEAPSKTEWYQKYFGSVATFLMFSIGDSSGCLLSRYSTWLTGKPGLVLTLSITRIIFIPIILVCNISDYPDKQLPIYITNDFIYMGLMILFSITHGYLWSALFVLIPRVVDSKEQEISSSMLSAFLGVGCIAGATMSFFYLTLL
ncbi:equilibrative nucleoside transporter 2-like isoform X2 [Aphidius gifuensis]|uniref:equilibrative nucleoside transporter 2-like isoform X2 n=1 Tax=Aphidius gifuensis TaxID=684658 RepID=UPI001CDC9C90|nr:equilibrative nucleoside transporter 2-like isoform X2 [Aphidius gifuensis]